MDSTANNLTIGQQIRANLHGGGSRSDRPFLTCLHDRRATEQFSYAQLVARALTWRRYFDQQMAGRGISESLQDLRVGIVIVLGHGVSLYASYLGAVLGGYVPAMFADPSEKYSEPRYAQVIGDLLDQADAELLVAGDGLADDLKPIIEQRGLHTQICSIGQFEAFEASGGLSVDLCNMLLAEVDCESVAFVQYSSGTTGLKKGVGISHRALSWQIDHYAQSLGLNHDDCIVSWLPLYHDMGLIACYWLALLKVVPVVAMSPFAWVRQPGLLFKAITQYRGTLCWLPNFAYSHLTASVPDQDLATCNLSSLRAVINCSEPVRAESHDGFLRRFEAIGLNKSALGTCYAMAENVFAVTSSGKRDGCVGCVSEHIDQAQFEQTGRAVVVSPSHPQALTLVSSGRALKHTQLRIVDGQGRDLPERIAGEILVKSPCLFEHYLGDVHARSSMFTDGWFHTGDLGYLADGQLFVTGRCKDLIIIAGRNIYPQDIEAIVNEVEGVVAGRCVVLGLDDPNLGTQRLIILAETRELDKPREPGEPGGPGGPGRPGGAVRHQLTQAIDTAVKDRADVAADDVQVVDHMWLAKSTSGKLARTENLVRYRQLIADKRARWNREDVRKSVLAIVRRYRESPDAPAASGQEAAKESNLISSGALDSLGLVKLIVDIESQFGITIPTDDRLRFEDFENVDSICRLIERQRDTTDTSYGVSSSGNVRDLKCLHFLSGPRRYDLLILGSSRVQNLSAQLAGQMGYTAYNFSVYSARAEDWYCIYQFVHQHNQIPLRRILLGIDIEAFTVGIGMDDRLIHNDYLAGYLDQADQDEVRGVQTEPFAGRREEALRNLRQRSTGGAGGGGGTGGAGGGGGAGGAGGITPLDYDPVSGDVLSARKEHSDRQHQTLQLTDIHSYNLEYKLRMTSFTRLNPKRLSYFVRMIQTCLSRNIHVTCFLTPLHPVLDQYLASHTNYKKRINELVAGLKNNHSPLFELHDFTLPHQFGGLDKDFIDPAHIGPANADKLMHQLLRPVKQNIH